ncbi:hypothetical protein AGMMS50212_16660 [Spirochaetia bacterium]|nr:hypothetical protein AGMMS50212_16660 [Spirochaetia bacterium]
MGAGQLFYVVIRLVIGAAAACFAIVLWSKTRDIAWMLMVLGTISSYIETVYSILGLLGITDYMITAGSVPIAAIIFSSLPEIFFISAFCVMLKKRMR